MAMFSRSRSRSRSRSEVDLRHRTVVITHEPLVCADRRMVSVDLRIQCVPHPPDPDGVIAPRPWPEGDETSLRVLVVTLLRVHAQELAVEELGGSRAEAVGRLDLAIGLGPVLGGWDAVTTVLEWHDVAGAAMPRSGWRVDVVEGL